MFTISKIKMTILKNRQIEFFELKTKQVEKRPQIKN